MDVNGFNVGRIWLRPGHIVMCIAIKLTRRSRRGRNDGSLEARRTGPVQVLRFEVYLPHGP